MVHTCLWLKSLRITCRRRMESHNKFNSLVCSQNMSGLGQNYLVSQNTQILIILFSRPLKCVFTELNATTNSFCSGRKRLWQPCENILLSDRTEDRKLIGKILLRPLPSPAQKMNTNLIILIEKWKIMGTRNYSQLIRTMLVTETIIVSFSTSLSNAFQQLLSSASQHPCFTTGVSAVPFWLRNSRFAGIRDKRTAENDKKARWILWCPLISKVCCLSAVTPCRVQMHTHEYTLSVSLFFPAVGFAVPPVLIPQEDIPYS